MLAEIMRFLKVWCKCGTVYITDSTHHEMKYCPNECGSSIDYETYSCRYIGKVPKRTELFQPPWFEDEEEYHSVLLGFLNDSDEEYTLTKKDNNLYIIKTI